MIHPGWAELPQSHIHKWNGGPGKAPPPEGAPSRHTEPCPERPKCPVLPSIPSQWKIPEDAGAESHKTLGSSCRTLRDPQRPPLGVGWHCPWIFGITRVGWFPEALRGRHAQRRTLAEWGDLRCHLDSALTLFAEWPQDSQPLGPHPSSVRRWGQPTGSPAASTLWQVRFKTPLWHLLVPKPRPWSPQGGFLCVLRHSGTRRERTRMLKASDEPM